MALQDFLRLSEDNIIVMNRYVNDPIEIEINNRSRIRGKIRNIQREQGSQDRGDYTLMNKEKQQPTRSLCCGVCCSLITAC